MTSSFFIRTSKTNPSATICLRITESRGNQYRFNTGHRLNKSSSWNSKTQSVRTVADERYDIINLQLKRLKAHVETQAVEAKSSGVHRSKSFYLGAIESFAVFEEGSAPKHRKQWNLKQAFDAFIAFSQDHNSPITGRRLKQSTLMTYIETMRHIRLVGLLDESLLGVDMDWYHTFIARSEDGGKAGKPLSLNYIGKHIKNVKRVLRFAEEQGQAVHVAYRRKSFKVHQEQATDVYLNKEELRRMRMLDLSPHPKGLQLTRDLFMIGCSTGLRVSDYTRLTPDHFLERDGRRFLQVLTTKTRREVIVPIDPVVDEIYERYGQAPPPYQVDQTINRNLKTLGEWAEIDDAIPVRRTEGGQLLNQRLPKYQLIKSHTARRSFCTNAYLAGMDCLDIMNLSGHTSEKAFLRYIKVTNEERAKRMADHGFFGG